MAENTVEQVSGRKLLLLFLAGPLVWTAHHLIGYLLVEAACRSGLERLSVLGFTALNFIIVVLTVVGVATLAWTGLAAYRLVRDGRVPGPEPPPEAAPPLPDPENSGSLTAREYFSRDRLAFGYPQFMLYAAVLLSALFAVTVLLNGIPALVLRPCAW